MDCRFSKLPSVVINNKTDQVFFPRTRTVTVVKPVKAQGIGRARVDVTWG